MDVRLVDIIFSPFMIPILILEDIERIKLLLIVIWSICASIVIWGCENDFEWFSNTYSWGDVYSGSSSHWRCRNITRKMKLLLSNIKIMVDGIHSSLKTRCDWCVGAFHCFSAISALEKYFLVRKLYQETGGHMLAFKIGTRQDLLVIWANRSDLSYKPVRLVRTTLSNFQLDFTVA